MTETLGICPFDNISSILRDELKKRIVPGTRVSVCAPVFSIYAFRDLKEVLKNVSAFRLLFTSPTFTAEQENPVMREFYIPRLQRENGLFGTEFEVRLRNELTQKAIAKECADWIQKKASFRSIKKNRESEAGSPCLTLENENGSCVYYPFSGFTTDALGTNSENRIPQMTFRVPRSGADHFFQNFEKNWNSSELTQDVKQKLIDQITTVYRENSPELVYMLTLYSIFGNIALDDDAERYMPKEKTGFRNSAIWKMLYSFQSDAAIAIIKKLEEFNGCILADSVGLGKTFTALAVIKYYESRNMRVLVLCPKKLYENWSTFNHNLKTNPLAGDRLSYDILMHTDLNREKGMSASGIQLNLVNWENYDLIVIDESHNFRNGGDYIGRNNDRENRYLTLMNKVIRSGVSTKVLMLSATPVNNRFTDLRNQIELACEGDTALISQKLKLKSDLKTVFRQAQKAFNEWSKLAETKRTVDELQKRLDFDFFKVLEGMTIARSRKHIEKYYDIAELGSFPKRRAPISLSPEMSNLTDTPTYSELCELLNRLNLEVYTPSRYLHPSKLDKYKLRGDHTGISLAGRENGLRRFVCVNLLKRLESSIDAFRLSLDRILSYIKTQLDVIRSYESGETVSSPRTAENDPADFEAQFDDDDLNADIFFVGGKHSQIDLTDMDYLSWARQLESDSDILKTLLNLIKPITPDHDEKLEILKQHIADKVKNPINPGNKKVLIFTAFADTANYLYKHLHQFLKAEYGLETAMITGKNDSKTTIPSVHTGDMNEILTLFSPVSKNKDAFMENDSREFDVLIATDCISEGQNLQDCDFLVNYDIHWNPVRIIQRFGRIDRIGSRNNEIQMVSFWPEMELDDYIRLKERVESKMSAAVMSGSGESNPLEADEENKSDLEYRKKQLERLKSDVVDLEEMSGGLSITDFGLNEFRMDLDSYLKTHPNMDQIPKGIHAVTYGEKPGVIWILKNRNQEIDKENRNQIHPYYIVFVGDDEEIICDHLHPRQALEEFRLLASGKKTPDPDACRLFNKKTENGRKMTAISKLLKASVKSIINVSEESAIDALFSGRETNFLDSAVSGLDDFELISFMVVIPK